MSLHRLSCVVVIWALTGCQSSQVANEGTKNLVQAMVDEPRVQLLVKFNGQSLPCLNEGEERSRCKDEGALFERIRKISVPVSEAREVLEALEANDEVEWAEVDQELEQAQFEPNPGLIPNDTLFPLQNHHYSVGTPYAWKAFTPYSPNVKVVVCDSGVTMHHEDLSENVRYDLCMNVVNGVRGDCRPFSSHGTEVAGIIAAKGNNGLGVTGVTWKAQLVPVQVVSEIRSGVALTKASHLAECLRYAVAIRADVANISFDTLDENGQVPRVLTEAALMAQSHGVMTVAAGGNKLAFNAKNSGPILHVGATTINGRGSLNEFGGGHLDVSAPGELIPTTWNKVQCQDFNQNGTHELDECSESPGGYTNGSAVGTSYAAPIVSGAAALLKSIYPFITPLEMECVLKGSSRDVGEFGRDPFFGEGFLQVEAAARRAQALYSNSAPNLTLPRGRSYKFPMATDVTLSVLDASDWQPAGQTVNLANRVQWHLPDGTIAVGSPAVVRFSKPGSFTVMVSVLDNGCRARTDFIDVTITNSAPSIFVPSLPHRETTVQPGEPVSITAQALDPEEGDISHRIEWYAVAADSSKTLVNRGAQFNQTYTTAGTRLFRLDVADADGLTASTMVVIDVRTLFNPPANPTDLVLTSPTRYMVSLRWKDNASDERGYQIERAEVLPSTGVGVYTRIGFVSTNVHVYRDFLPSGTYSYRVRAVNSTGYSEWLEGKLLVK